MTPNRTNVGRYVLDEVTPRIEDSSHDSYTFTGNHIEEMRNLIEGSRDFRFPVIEKIEHKDYSNLSIYQGGDCAITLHVTSGPDTTPGQDVTSNPEVTHLRIFNNAEHKRDESLRKLEKIWAE